MSQKTFHNKQDYLDVQQIEAFNRDARVKAFEEDYWQKQLTNESTELNSNLQIEEDHEVEHIIIIDKFKHEGGREDPLYIIAAKMFADFYGEKFFYINPDTETAHVNRTIDIGGIQISIKVTFDKSMSRTDLLEIMSAWGMSYNSSYEFYLFGTGMDDTWSHWGNWMEWYYFKTPPAPVELLARFAMAVPGTVYGWVTGEDWMSDEKLSGWEQVFGILDIIPGESLAKLGVSSLLFKIGDKTIDLAKPGVKIVLEGLRTQKIKPYKEWTKIKSKLGFGQDIHAHHIFEKAQLERLGFDSRNAPSVLLTNSEHAKYTKKLASLTYGKNLSKDELLNIYREVYKDKPDWIKAIENYVNQ